MAIRAKYVGPDYLNGIPARDLEEEEYRSLTNEERESVRESGNYEVLTDAEYTDLVRTEKRGDRGPRPPTPETPSPLPTPKAGDEPKDNGGSAT